MANGRPAKRRRITPPLDNRAVSETINAKDLFNRAADWNLEQAYERRPRRREQKESTRLPIKTAEGRIEQIRESLAANDEDEDSDIFSATDNEDARQGETPPTEEAERMPQMPLKQQVIVAQEELAKIAGLINEDPEEHSNLFKKLSELTASASQPVVKNLGLATQAAVYVDVIPGYRIRAYNEEDLGSKVSKDVRKLRQYEQALVSGYQTYVKQLAKEFRRSRRKGKSSSNTPSVPTTCVCKLLISVPHFNFRTDLLKVVVDQLSSQQTSADFRKCLDTLSEFFATDDDGAPSFEAVTLLTKMMKAKDYRVHEDVLNTFFNLRLLSELSPQTSDAKTDNANQPTYHGKKLKSKWEHRTKRERKIARERRAVEKDMKEASAIVDHTEREKLQSETLKAVFATYLRILKLRIAGLIGPVLEGLAKFAHLINQDLFGDLLEVLKDIITRHEAEAAEKIEKNTTPTITKRGEEIEEIGTDFRTPLLATQTAFTLLSSQEVSKSASALHLDLSFFTAYTYRTLYPLALSPSLEPSTALPAPNPNSYSPTTTSKDDPPPHKINVSTPTLLLTRILSSLLLPPSSPPPTPTLLAAFLKRLLTLSLHTPEKSTLALLALLSQITTKHGRKVNSLWHSEERQGEGVFDGKAETVEGTRVWSAGTGVWEGEVLRRHFCPGVREGWEGVQGVIRGLEGEGG